MDKDFWLVLEKKNNIGFWSIKLRKFLDLMKNAVP